MAPVLLQRPVKAGEQQDEDMEKAGKDRGCPDEGGCVHTSF